MNLSTRTLGLALPLLLLFLGATVTLQWWLARETRQLRNAAIGEERAHLLGAVALADRPPGAWDRAFLDELGVALGGSVELFEPDVESPPVDHDAPILSFVQELPSAPGWRVRVKFAAPALLRIQVLHQRMLTVIVILALLVTTVPLLLVMIISRRSSLPEGASRAPWAAKRSANLGLEHFARISHERSAALELEQGARQRAEENLQINRTLLHQSVEERIRLGRELHDNISQTLYAVCLTLESVRKKNTLAPEHQRRVDQCMTELRRLNQEVRSYLKDLEPARLNTQSFTGAIGDMLEAFKVGGDLRVEQRLDEEAVALIPAEQIADVVNILREAVSNAVRHGRATHITLLAGRSDEEVALAIQDDGAGFLAQADGGPGHGFANMQARAEALGGNLRIESAPGKGTRVLLNLPVPSRA